MAAKTGSSAGRKDEKQYVCRNRRAQHEYEILHKLDCGIALLGSEVKSIRNGKMVIDEAYARVQEGEVWLINADIGEYAQASYLNHERQRPRKLLLRRREIQKFAEAASQKGLTMIPLAVFFDRGFVKVTLAIGRGRQLHDKREKLKKDASQRELRDAMRKRRT
jgi:SsrA-binding protein